MKAQIFINLPVKDLKQSMDFYTAVGFTNNPVFTDETAACMVYSEEIYVMLLTHAKFNEFIDKVIADTKTTAAVINALGLDSKKRVDETVEKAVNAGGRETKEPVDYDFMWQRTFEDPDGHLWEVFFMDMDKFPQE